MRSFLYFIVSVSFFCFNSCSSQTEKNFLSDIKPENFRAIVNQKPVDIYFLKNNGDLQMAVCNYGAKVVSLYSKDKNGNYDDIVLGYDSLCDYLNPEKKLTGSVVGRVAGRINAGRFEIDGKEYRLHQVNERNFHAHGGLNGFDKVAWEVINHTANSITLQYISVDGEEGYPGTLATTMTYELTDENIFRITYTAQTDRTTPVNLTHHSFFNLAGAGSRNVENHILHVNATSYLPILPTTINTGEIAETQNTPMDFGTYRRVGDSINSSFHQIQIAKGYDHTWVIDRNEKNLSYAASIFEPVSGRKMEVYTDQPCIHFYTAKMSKPKIGKSGKEYGNRSGFCMETMHYPDAMNQPNFPTYYLYPDEIYRHICEFRFSVAE